MRKPLVYIASPYTKGDQALNVRFQMEAFNSLLSDNVVLPIAPLWSHFQHLAFPRLYEDWLSYDLELIDRCDILLRLTAVIPSMTYTQWESKGAKREEAHARSRGIPVFHDIRLMYNFLETGPKRPPIL